jgi:hypothetical protein
VIYRILFKAAAETLRTIAGDPKHLGAQIGATLVLVWSKNSCDNQMVIFQQPTQAFVTAD